MVVKRPSIFQQSLGLVNQEIKLPFSSLRSQVSLWSTAESGQHRSLKPGEKHIHLYESISVRVAFWLDVSAPNLQRKVSLTQSLHGCFEFIRMSDPMDFQWTTPRSPPFDILTFDPETLSKEFKDTARLDPDLCLVDARPTLEHATSRRDWVRRNTAVEVSSSVLALGKDPYPGLKVSRKVPEWYMTTILEYDYSKPWFGDSLILHYLTPARLLELGCINTDTTPVSKRFRIDADVAAKASIFRLTPNYIGNHDGIHPIVRRGNFNLTSDFEYECLKPTLRVVTKLLEMDSVLDMLWALGQRWTQVQGTKLMKDVYVYYTGQSTPQQRQETALELLQLTGYVNFGWSNTNTSNNAHGTTETVVGKPGLRGGTTT